MRRDYLENMKADGFEEFLSACESIKNCKYILAESKITALLKSIADNKRLYALFGNVLYGFDYNCVFSESVNGGVFSLPSDPASAIALVFRILLDIDSGKMSLRNFLEAYFYGVSINESYARFCLEIIAPFESYCRAAFSQPDLLVPISVRDGNDGQDETYSDKFRNELKADALKCVATLIDIADSVISGIIDRAEFTACLKGLVRAVNGDDYENIISSFIGVKYAVAYFFKSTKTVLDIYKKLEYDIKHLADK